MKLFGKYIFLVIVIALLCILNSKFSPFCFSPAFASYPTHSLLNYAQSLTTKGHEQLALGQSEEALQTWEKATEVYTKLGDLEGMAGSRINQSMALQALGQYRRACHTLLMAMKLDYQNNLACQQPYETEESINTQGELLQVALTQLENSQVNRIGLRHLGDVLRAIGNIENSEKVLNKSLEWAKQSQSIADVSTILVSLGNTNRAWYSRRRNLYSITGLPNDQIEAVFKAEASLKFYQEACRYAKEVSTGSPSYIQSQINSLNLLLDLEPWLEQESKGGDSQILLQLAKIQSQIQPLVEELLQNPLAFSSLSPIQSIYAKLNFVLSLQKLKRPDRLAIALAWGQDAWRNAKALDHRRAEAYASGILGNLYQDLHELSLAQSWIEKAVLISQSLQATDLAYQWQYQLGRIYEKRERFTEAIVAYREAIESLESVRTDLLSINPEIQFSFRENVEPVYEDLIRLLLRSQPSQDQLKQVTEVMELFQFAELQNFLQCKLDSVSLTEVKNAPDAVIYMMVLEPYNRVEAIVNLPKAPTLSKFYHYSVEWSKVKEALEGLQEGLQGQAVRKLSLDRTSSYSQQLYQALLSPTKQYLPPTGSLVFALDSELQRIPMALLQDPNRHYVVEDYSITVSFGARSHEPRFLPWAESSVLLAGVRQGPSFTQRSSLFQELPNVEFELELIKKNVVKSETLYNDKFTKNRLQNKISTSTFPIVHIATHGVFSSNPEQTVLLAYDDGINLRQLDQLLRSRNQSRRDRIELLVLSACQTAIGDKRASLGIAGVAVQAGARSTLASLWNVSDRSTALLMGEFYRGLKMGLTKAEALRSAQLAFLKNPEYKKNYAHPYYWAAFILVGSWL